MLGIPTMNTVFEILSGLLLKHMLKISYTPNYYKKKNTCKETSPKVVKV